MRLHVNKYVVYYAAIVFDYQYFCNRRSCCNYYPCCCYYYLLPLLLPLLCLHTSTKLLVALKAMNYINNFFFSLSLLQVSIIFHIQLVDTAEQRVLYIIIMKHQYFCFKLYFYLSLFLLVMCLLQIFIFYYICLSNCFNDCLFK